MIKLTTTILTLCALSLGAQNVAKHKGFSMKERMASKNQSAFNKDKITTQNISANNNASASSLEKNVSSVTTFTPFSSSANIYGVTISASEPLQYNDDVNAVSFIQRKSDTYVANPYDNTGAVMAMISSNWGNAWDSTCLYSDNTNFGRYPQGAVYNAPGNTNIANAYVVGSGPVLDAGFSWSGNWFASKQIGTAGSTVFNSTASQAPSAQQFFSTYGPFGPTVFSNNFASYGFTSSDDGTVKSLGQLTSDPNAIPVDVRGAVIQTGSFNAGVFTWKTDSFLPPVIVKTDQYKQMSDHAIMAWNEAGTVGYVVFIGSQTSQTLSNTGWQPIIYKTTTSGNSWVQITGIDFNSPTYQLIKDRLDPVSTNSTLVIPMFTPYEGIDCVVDANNKLHISGLIASSASSDNDSLDYTNGYTAEEYVWPHAPGQQPYLYDFIGDGSSPWTFLTIDSLGSEAPSSTSGYPGFSDNPWDDDQGKVTSDSRVQLSRTPDGQYIVYTYAESDPAFMLKNWNIEPNIKARMWSCNPGFPVGLSTTEINVTKPAILDVNVANRAMFHFTSPTSSAASITAVASSATVQVKTPMTITHNYPYVQGAPNTHYFTTGVLDFVYSNITLGVNANNNVALPFSIYPNPTSQKCMVDLDLLNSSDVEISVLNYLGQVVNEKNYKAQFGKNQIELDLSNIKTGIYFVNIKTGNITSTKKLIIE